MFWPCWRCCKDSGPKLFSLSQIGSHVRLLVAIPLLFVCETWLDPLMTAFVSGIAGSGVVPKDEQPKLESLVRRVVRWKNSWRADTFCLLVAVLFSLLAGQLHLPGATIAHSAMHTEGRLTLAGGWYWIVCLPLFRFLMFRWALRLIHWWYFLLLVARLKLHLVPTHPDGAAGLGYLEIVHLQFTPLVLAISAVLSSSFAEEISTGVMTIEALYPQIAVILGVDAVLFLGPLCIFTPKLSACREKGLNDYMTFAAHYVHRFDEKWLGADAAGEAELLGTPDLQSLSHLSNSVNVVRNMRWIPASKRLALSLAISALLPLLPLLLFKYPVVELVKKLLSILSGR